MSVDGSKYFTLTLDSLRAIGGWSADCAERALAVYESHAGSDSRPRAAIEGIREFAAGGRRAARLRTLAVAAHAAAREIGDPAAAAAARAAGTAAASAYTHPLADVQQTKHVVGAAAYAALALELDGGGDPSVGDGEVRWAIKHAPHEAQEVLLWMPARQAGRSRWEGLLFELDAGIRARIPQRFYHGTRADLQPGDLIGSGRSSNFGAGKQANFVYLTATLDAATWGAELALGDGPGRIYLVEPTGPFEDDPNLTDKRFPGNPTMSYRSREALRVIGEVTDWQGHAPEVLKGMRDRVAEMKRLGVEAIND